MGAEGNIRRQGVNLRSDLWAAAVCEGHPRPQGRAAQLGGSGPRGASAGSPRTRTLSSRGELTHSHIHTHVHTLTHAVVSQHPEGRDSWPLLSVLSPRISLSQHPEMWAPAFLSGKK